MLTPGAGNGSRAELYMGVWSEVVMRVSHCCFLHYCVKIQLLRFVLGYAQACLKLSFLKVINQTCSIDRERSGKKGQLYRDNLVEIQHVLYAIHISLHLKMKPLIGV